MTNDEQTQNASAARDQRWKHIGDGVYVHFDVYGRAWVSLQNQPSRLCEQGICLEPEVMAALIEFARKAGMEL